MADESSYAIQAPDDDEEKKFVAGPQPKAAYGPFPTAPVTNGGASIVPMPAPAIPAVAARAPQMEAPSITNPTPVASGIPDTGGSVAMGPQNKDYAREYAAESSMSPERKQNPFAVLMAHEDAIHSAPLRVLSKVATGLAAGAEGLSKDYPEIERERATEAAAPGEAAQRQAVTAHEVADTAAIPSETALRAAQTGHEQAETAALGKPTLLTGADDIRFVDGVEQDRYKNPDGSIQWVTAGQAPQAPAGSAAPAPAAGQAAPPVAGPQNVTYGIPAKTTPEEAAKLAPVGENAQAYNKQISDALGSKAGDFQVKPTDSKEDAEKKLADARAQSEADRGKASEARGAASEARANANEDIKPVQATDADGRTIITNLGDARKRGLTDVLPVGETEIANARSTLTNVNLMEQALKNMKENLSDFDALTWQDKGYLNKILNSPAMVPQGGLVGYLSGTVSGNIESLVQSAEYQNMSEPAKNILRNIANLRESSLGLGKLETGGSRAMQSAIDAINTTIPGRNVTNSKDAETQLRMFADRLDEIKNDAPIIKGHAFRDNPFSESQGSWKLPEGAPPAKGVPDGKVLKQDGRIVAVAKGGAWAKP